MNFSLSSFDLVLLSVGLISGILFASLMSYVKFRNREMAFTLELQKLTQHIESLEQNLYENRDLADQAERMRWELQAVREQNSALSAEIRQLPILNEQLSQIQEKWNQSRQELLEARQACVELKTRVDTQQQEFIRREQMLLETRQLFEREFNSVATRLMEEKTERMTHQNRIQVGEILSPLREQLQDFRRKVEDVYDKEAKDRVALHREISLLRDLNVRISHEAENLAKALKGDNKSQGTWGELVLERILELSGLVKGREFEVQPSYRNAEGQVFRPDIVVHLPDGKDVVIDSKVSLLHWEAFCSAETEPEARDALRGLLQSLRAHIRGLSGKRYEDLPGMRSLDFVLLFIPVEAVFLKVVEAEPDILVEANSKGLMLVCPSTLLTTLRTIQSLWRYEYQNRNALRIAECAGGLHDQFVIVIEAIKDLGDRLGKASQAYDSLCKRMMDGKGNVIKRVVELKTLGAKTRRKLDMNETDNREIGSVEADVPDLGNTEKI